MSPSGLYTDTHLGSNPWDGRCVLRYLTVSPEAPTWAVLNRIGIYVMGNSVVPRSSQGWRTGLSSRQMLARMTSHSQVGRTLSHNATA